MSKAKGKCLIPGCDRDAWSRGQCWSCLSTTRRLVKDEKTTWAEVEAKGYAVPLKRSRVAEALAAAKPKRSKRNG